MSERLVYEIDGDPFSEIGFRDWEALDTVLMALTEYQPGMKHTIRVHNSATTIIVYPFERGIRRTPQVPVKVDTRRSTVQVTGKFEPSDASVPAFHRANLADTLLLFVCPTPDDAEATVGDLMENFAKVAARRSAFVSNLWFGWELSLLVLTKARQRFMKSFFGPFLDKWFKSAGS